MPTFVKVQTKIVATITADDRVPRQFDIPPHHIRVVQELCRNLCKVTAVRFIKDEYELGLLDAKLLTEEIAAISGVQSIL